MKVKIVNVFGNGRCAPRKSELSASWDMCAVRNSVVCLDDVKRSARQHGKQMESKFSRRTSLTTSRILHNSSTHAGVSLNLDAGAWE
jgi:hypothetical protein